MSAPVQPAAVDETDRDDRIWPATRVVAALVLPVLLVAAAILYLVPGETGRLWAWPIKPALTALVMGSGYLSGAYFFTRVLTSNTWHYVTRGFLPITVFTWVLLSATIVHWDRFTHGHIAFWAWTAIYAITPSLIPVLWLRNRTVDPHVVAPDDAVGPEAKWALAAVGVGGLFIAIFLFVVPQRAMRVWPWQITPLGARTMAGWFALTGAIGLSLAGEPRWSAWRVLVEAALLWGVLLLVAIVRAWRDFDLSNLLTWIAVGSLAGLVAGLGGLYIAMERRGSTGRARAPD